MRDVPKRVRQMGTQGHDPRQIRAVLHALPPLQIHRFQKCRRPKCHRDGFPMASSTLLVLSLRSPLFPVSLANSRRGHGVRPNVRRTRYDRIQPSESPVRAAENSHGPVAWAYLRRFSWFACTLPTSSSGWPRCGAALPPLASGGLASVFELQHLCGGKTRNSFQG